MHEMCFKMCPLSYRKLCSKGVVESYDFLLLPLASSKFNPKSSPHKVYSDYLKKIRAETEVKHPHEADQCCLLMRLL